MQNHFILKLSDTLSDTIKNDIKNNTYDHIEIQTINTQTHFIYKNIQYPTIFYNLPCILEVQKTMDNKQFYKVADVSNCLYVFEKTDKIENVAGLGTNLFNPITTTSNSTQEQENTIRKVITNINSHILGNKSITRNVLENSGISPSLNYIKIRNFKKKPKNIQIDSIDYCELKVKELLEKERRATSVEIMFGKDDEDDDVSSFAAEIENSLIQEDKSEVNQDMLVKMQIIADLEEKIKIKKEQMEGSSNVIVQKRFKEMLDKLNEQYDIVKKELDDLEVLKRNI